MRRLTIFLIFLVWSGCAHGQTNTFWRHWSDGHAEVSGYTLTVNRYGQRRQGQAVLIYVTEPFSISKGVKVDHYDPKNGDHTIVLKLNLLKRFRTGVYEYALMTSVFSLPQQKFRTVKSTFSSQEWCGQTFERLSIKDGETLLRIESYFEGESETKRFSERLDTEDALWIQARGLMAGGPGDGMPTAKRVLSAAHRRLNHRVAQPRPLKTRWSAPKTVTAPIGEVVIRSLSWQRSRTVGCTLQIEVAAPHRVVGWQCDDGEMAQLTGTQRMPYWQQARLGDERLLKGLGLSPQ